MVVIVVGVMFECVLKVLRFGLCVIMNFMSVFVKLGECENCCREDVLRLLSDRNCVNMFGCFFSYVRIVMVIFCVFGVVLVFFLGFKCIFNFGL